MELKNNIQGHEVLVLENSNEIDAVRFAVNFAANSIPFWRLDRRAERDELRHDRVMLAGAIRRGFGIGEGLPTEPSPLILNARETELALSSMRKLAATEDLGENGPSQYTQDILDSIKTEQVAV